MKLGSDVRSTTVPLNQPMVSASAKVSGTAMNRFSPAPPEAGSMLSSTTTMAAAPVIAPEERSNSPPIMSSATGTAMMPRIAAVSR